MNKLREIRKTKGISQWRLAYDARVFQSKISLCENGLIEFDEEEKKRIAEALRAPIKEIFGNKINQRGG
jgi:DNA-binding XRE family transcriptional regulator